MKSFLGLKEKRSWLPTELKLSEMEEEIRYLAIQIADQAASGVGPIVYMYRLGVHYSRQDIDTLKRIQGRATKMMRGLEKITYEERLWKCGLTN